MKITVIAQGMKAAVKLQTANEMVMRMNTSQHRGELGKGKMDWVRDQDGTTVEQIVCIVEKCFQCVFHLYIQKNKQGTGFKTLVNYSFYYFKMYF